jgi:hypothetical protein
MFPLGRSEIAQALNADLPEVDFGDKRDTTLDIGSSARSELLLGRSGGRSVILPSAK